MSHDDCACDNCGAIQLPDMCCLPADMPQLRRIGQTELATWQAILVPRHDQSLPAQRFSPLQSANHFITQVDDLLAATIIIS
jgi:hypothetical protein